MATGRGRRAWRSLVRDYGPYLPLSPYLFVVLFPFYWMLITAFKRDNDLYNLTTAPFWFKEPPTLGHLDLLLRHTLFLTWLKNSLFIGACVVAITLLLLVAACRRRRYGTMAAARASGRGWFVTLLRVPRAPLAAWTRGGGGS